MQLAVCRDEVRRLRHLTQIPKHCNNKRRRVARFTRMMSKSSGPTPCNHASLSLDHQAAVDSCICMHGCSRSRAAISHTPVDQLPLRPALRAGCVERRGSSATVCKCCGIGRADAGLSLASSDPSLLSASLRLITEGPVRGCRVILGSPIQSHAFKLNLRVSGA